MNYVYRNSARAHHVLHFIQADIPPYFRATRLTALSGDCAPLISQAVRRLCENFTESSPASKG